MTKKSTLFEKLWNDHLIIELDGATGLLAVDRIFLHERTGAAALNSLAQSGRKVVDPTRVFAVMDHIVDTRPGRGDQTLMPGGQAFITETRSAAVGAEITLFDVSDPNQGITHVIGPELGIVLPGLTLVAPDSHTCTQGAFGALAWGIGSSEAEHAMATGTLRVSRPKTMRVTISGPIGLGVTAKDLVLALIATHGSAGGQGYAVEFAGDTVSTMDMEQRMTLCNMATEFSAMSGFIAPDDITLTWLKGRKYAPQGLDWERACAYWSTLKSDAGAPFDAELELDAESLEPMVSWGTNPQASLGILGQIPDNADRSSLSYMGLEAGQTLKGLPIDGVFIGSCTNGRLGDLRRAAAILKGRKIKSGLVALCVPGSSAVRRAAEAEGLDQIFIDAGFEWRESGCSLCFYAGGESFAPGSRVVSSTNRNFESRQGDKVRTHIASPETVAASALAGRIADPRDLSHE